jgi:hypothetical protein
VSRSTDRAHGRLAELVAALSLGIDLGFGQPMEHVLRQCLIALRLADRLGVEEPGRAAIYYSALLVNVGCHSDAHEQAKWFGDALALLTGLALADSASAAPDQVLRTGKFVPLDPDVAPAGYLALQANSPSQLIVIRHRPVCSSSGRSCLSRVRRRACTATRSTARASRVPANADVFSFDSLVLGPCDSDKRARWRI